MYARVYRRRRRKEVVVVGRIERTDAFRSLRFIFGSRIEDSIDYAKGYSPE